MRVDIKKLATAVVDAADGKTAAQVKTLMEGVVKLLAEERVLGKWRQLERAIEKAWATRFGAANVTVVSAHALSTEARDAITAHANGAELTEIVDNRLIGGAIIRIDNTRIDGSVTGALMRLKNKMYTVV